MVRPCKWAGACLDCVEPQDSRALRESRRCMMVRLRKPIDPQSLRWISHAHRKENGERRFVRRKVGNAIIADGQTVHVLR